MRLRIAFKIWGVIKNEDGSPHPIGVCLDAGETEADIPYEELAAHINKEAILEHLGMSGTVHPDDMELITPEEYDQEYGAEEESDVAAP